MTAFFQWSYPGPECITHFRIEITLDSGTGKYEAYAPSYQFVQDFAPDQLFWDSTLEFYLDPTEWNRCGFYHWQVFAVAGDETGEPSVPFSFSVCDVDG